MRTKTVKRYYCDFCSKGMFRIPDMARHEAGCTKNPNRVCWNCDRKEPIGNLVAELRGRFLGLEPNESATANKEDVDWLFEKVDGCPLCVLSVLRQANVFAFEHFDYRKSMGFWNQSIL